MPGDAFEALMGLWREIPSHAGMKVLDASCGKGLTTQALMEAGFDVTATNYSRERHPRMPPDVRFVGGVDLNGRLPFEDGSFDGVNLREVFEHLENPAHTVREFARVLRPGGVWVLATPNILNCLSRTRLLVAGFFQGLNRPVSYAKPTGDADNLYVTNLPQLHYLLAQSGMSIEAMRLGHYEWRSLLLAVALYPAIWLGTTAALWRVHRKDVLMKDDRLKAAEEVIQDLRARQKLVHGRLRRLLLSKEVLLGRSLILRARKTGASPFDA